MSLRALLLLLSIFWWSPSGLSAIYDGGSYSDEKVAAPLGSTGGRTGYALPFEVAYIEDREQKVPADHALYVFGEDHICYKAKFSSGPDNALVIFSRPTFTASHCIYQKKFNQELAGFSIFAEDGGLCMPTYSDAPLNEFNDDPKDKLQVVHHRVSFSYCVDNTISYGDALEGKKPLPAAKIAKARPTPVPEPPKRQVASPEPLGELPKNEGEVFKHKYTVQLASFETSTEAVQSIKDYDSKGVQTFEFVQMSQGKMRHRVCAGTFDDMPSAQRSLRKINEKSIAKAFVQTLHPKNE